MTLRISSILALGLACQPALADVARLDVIGFSPDGQYFAFSQHGVNDGLGDPYAELFVIDVADDSWAPGTPLRIGITAEELSTLHASREDPVARVEGTFDRETAPALERYGIDGQHPGQLLARRTVFDRADAMRLSFTQLADGGAPYTIRLETDETAGCDPTIVELFGPGRRFSLTLDGGPLGATELHRDSTLPASRGCPQAYRLHDVITYRASHSGPVSLAVIVAMGLPGFEQLDWRYLAVTAKLPDLPYF